MSIFDTISSAFSSGGAISNTYSSFTKALQGDFQGQSSFPVGSDYQAQAAWSKKQESNKGLTNIASTLAGALDKFTAAKKAKDYRDDAAASKKVAYENMRAIADYKKQSNLTQATYMQGILNDNANIMMANAFNIRAAADISQSIQQRQEAKDLGTVRAISAGSGAAFTGSEKDVIASVTQTHEKSQFSNRVKTINEIQDQLNNATRTRLQSAMVGWSVTEQNKFIDINTQQSLY